MQALAPIKKISLVERQDSVMLDASWLSNKAFLAIAQRRMLRGKQPRISLSDLIAAKYPNRPPWPAPQPSPAPLSARAPRTLP